MTDTCTTRAIRCFSGHAVRRCLERGISALHVEQALEQGVLVAEGEGTGTWARGRLRVVVSRDGMAHAAPQPQAAHPEITEPEAAGEAPFPCTGGTMKKELPMRAQRAITVTMPYQRAYAAPLPRHRWQIILPGTGEVLVLTEDEFSETWVLESECPLAVRKLFDGFESYARWRWGK